MMARYWDESILSEVVKYLAGGRLLLFAGAGVSQLAGFPSWTQFVRKAIDRYRELPRHLPDVALELDSLVKSPRGIVVFNHILSLGTLGQEAYYDLLGAFAEEKCHDIHECLLDLPFAGYVTTNYDRCFEYAVSRGRDGKKALTTSRWLCHPKNEYDSFGNEISDAVLAKPEPFLLHMHGCLMCGRKKAPNDIILTDEQYGRWYTKHPEVIHTIYRSCFLGPMLITGTSLSDPFFHNNLITYRTSLDMNNRANRCPCFVMLHRDEREKVTARSDEEVYGLKYVYFDDWDNGLLNMIRELASRYHSMTAGAFEPNKNPAEVP